MRSFFARPSLPHVCVSAFPHGLSVARYLFLIFFFSLFLRTISFCTCRRFAGPFRQRSGLTIGSHTTVRISNGMSPVSFIPRPVCRLTLKAVDRLQSEHIPGATKVFVTFPVHPGRRQAHADAPTAVSVLLKLADKPSAVI